MSSITTIELSFNSTLSERWSRLRKTVLAWTLEYALPARWGMSTRHHLGIGGDEVGSVPHWNAFVANPIAAGREFGDLKLPKRAIYQPRRRPDYIQFAGLAVLSTGYSFPTATSRELRCGGLARRRAIQRQGLVQQLPCRAAVVRADVDQCDT